MTATSGPHGGQPLVVLHGRAEDEHRSLRIAERFDADQAFRVLAPRAPSRVEGGYSWFPTLGERSTRVTVSQIEKAVLEFCDHEDLDPANTCLLGFSEGAAAALSLAYRSNAKMRPAAVIAVGGFQPRGVAFDAPPPLPPALLINGTDDKVISAAEVDHLEATLTSLGVATTRYRVDAGHEVNREILNDAARWLHALPPCRPVTTDP